MRKQRLSVFVAFTFVFGLLAGIASAGTPMVDFDIPFAFNVQGTTMQAGMYAVIVDGSKGSGVSLKSGGSRQTTRLAVVTRLADLEGTKARLVFDRVGDVKYLSEIHIPGMDGYSLQGAADEHGHEKVSAKQ